MNAPRITSRPSCSAAAAKPTSNTTAPRTRIWAVVSWSLIRFELILIEPSALRTTRTTTAASTTSQPIRSRVAPTPPSPEKKTESRITAPKSAIVPAAITSWPKVVSIWPLSLSTGIRTPSEVAQSVIAISSGVSIRPVARRRTATVIASANEATKATVVTRRTCPRRREKSISRPARNKRKARPRTATTEIESSTSTIPSTEGPTMIPAVISSTTDGRRNLGNRPSTNGTTKATATMIRSPLNEGMTRNASTREFVTA